MKQKNLRWHLLQLWGDLMFTGIIQDIGFISHKDKVVSGIDKYWFNKL